MRAFEARRSVAANTGSRWVDQIPYPRTSSPIVISSWGCQLRVNTPGDRRLRRFVDDFPLSPRFTPEYGGECTGGAGRTLPVGARVHVGTTPSCRGAGPSHRATPRHGAARAQPSRQAAARDALTAAAGTTEVDNMAIMIPI